MVDGNAYRPPGGVVDPPGSHPLGSGAEPTEHQRAIDALQQSEARFKAVVESVPGHIWTAGPNGLVDYAGPWLSQHTGLPPEALLNSAWTEVVHPDDLPPTLKLWANARATASPYVAEFRIRGHDGGYKWFLTRASPQLDARGAITKWFGYTMNVDEQKRATDQLQRTHDTFYHLIQSTPFGLYVVDADLRIRQVSQGAHKVFASVMPVIGRDLAEVLNVLWPADFAAQATARFKHTLDTGEPFAAPTLIERRADVHEVESYDWKVERLTLPDGSHGVVCYFYDLSERQRFEEALKTSESFHRQTLESLPGMVFTATADGMFDYVSEQWVGYTGEAATQHHGSGWLHVVHPDELSRVMSAWRAAIAASGDYDIEHRVRGKDGAYEWFKVRGRPLLDDLGEVVRWSGAAVNIEGLKRAEAARVNRERELQEAEEALKDADRRKDEFLATLAHELRNPLAPIRSGLQILRLTDANGTTSKRALDVMERQISHMVRLIDDLLDVSRITRGKVELKRERHDLRAVIENAIEASKPLIDGGAHSLMVRLPDDPLPVDADPTRMAQVISNILNNAAKYTPKGGVIEVWAQQEGPEAVVHVKDNGVGIAHDMLPSVFDMFTQVGRTLDRAQGGLGIGLSLAKTLVELHGGKIAAESPGLAQGSTFSVRLPLESFLDSQLDASPVPSEAMGAGGPRRILIVDDNEDAAETLAMTLQLKGNAARTANTGNDALEIARQFRPEVIFCDIGMPGMTGYDVARQVRIDPALTQTILIAVTGWGTDEDKRRADHAGFDFHLTKPVQAESVDDLLARMPSTLGIAKRPE